MIVCVCDVFVYACMMCDCYGEGEGEACDACVYACMTCDVCMRV